MLQVIDLEKKFKNHLAVDGVNLNIEKGESIGLLGPNGAGKSTTISMISTLIEPTAGMIYFNGENIIKKPSSIRPVLGVVPQEIALYDELTAAENMRFFGRAYGLKGEALDQKVSEVLELVGLTDRQKDRIKEFSGGMKRRINIGVSLMHNPQLLIMDEPTVGIDPQSRNYILEMVRKLNVEKGMAILYTSHYMEEVEKLCDRIYIMDHGQIIASGTQSELKSILSSEDAMQINVQSKSMPFEHQLATHPLIHKVIENNGGYKLIVMKGEDLFSDIFAMAKRCDVKIVGMHVEDNSLEDVFLHLTGRKLRD
ncbi:antibiotic ABC transporter ATP-binding protein [Erysipelothrix larvae]|uniref:Antibiotic ABC transporter ATP-binding protein n=1 Tax=Erysipelothrix larvae TaxID=1514105 RepID=A0A0X8GZE2_9FIRM|nr:ABC transporter ATP-binding protein [Erysipelothrix larvae]AMC93221.1 antibiotic ABC transporter ATP-binding protein [Erysipelothrix larvae]